MRKFSTRGLIAVLCVTALLSCKRERARKSGLEIVDCRIKQLVMKSEGEKDKTGSFTYNVIGNPVTYTPTAYGSGALKYEFRYDKTGRLTDYIGYSPTTLPLSCEFWVRYIYNNNSIVRDSVYHNSNYGPVLTSYAKHVGVTEYGYDDQERISSITYRQFDNGVVNGVMAYYKFDYNQDGNLVVPGAVYDDRVSIYRTNKIWMFLSRNYSANNLRSALAYNSKGLPLMFATAEARTAQMKFFESLDLSNCDIFYECPR